VDLQKVFPRKFHSEFHRNLLYQHVCFALSFISVSKGHEYQKIEFILPNFLTSGPQIFIYHPTSLAQASWWLDHCGELVGWVQPPNQDPFYNPFAPILYWDYQGQQDIKTLFFNKALFDVSSLFSHQHSL